MFGNRGLFSGSGRNCNHLVEFRAGRMNLVGKVVHADVRKGLLYMLQSGNGLMHLCWKDRGTDMVEEDLIVFPNDFECQRMHQCVTGRVYLLKFRESTRRLFFWMQEPRTDRDEEYFQRINFLLNNPPVLRQRQVQHPLNILSRPQLIALLEGFGSLRGLNGMLDDMNYRMALMREFFNGDRSGPMQGLQNVIMPLQSQPSSTQGNGAPSLEVTSSGSLEPSGAGVAAATNEEESPPSLVAKRRRVAESVDGKFEMASGNETVKNEPKDSNARAGDEDKNIKKSSGEAAETQELKSSNASVAPDEVMKRKEDEQDEKPEKTDEEADDFPGLLQDQEGSAVDELLEYKQVDGDPKFAKVPEKTEEIGDTAIMELHVSDASEEDAVEKP
ncbi:proteasomal ubiquitin receptor ADRM1 homolog [Scaptodrosophila lebanonensis]|uniref:Proteasomal ubiquitin receptor ADRM1 homolog n=1 Tax=Drosophila lebanonensis TaxID=7225 RepID=A0A6J2UGG3_DROLE|nr:proteasomal ubiquitin receptor ADRM1 homolog [Scaptodrosophila lebanonensis]